MASKASQRVLLIDGDICVYQIAATAETPVEWHAGFWTLHADALAAQDQLDIYLDKLKLALDADKVVVALTDAVNFRHGIYPAYKSNRKDTRKPMVIPALREHLTLNWEVFQRPGLEGDDVLGILATSNQLFPGEKIIVSMDKDMRCIPAKIYSTKHPELGVVDVGLEEADRWHMTQTLTGDVTDGYPGCPGCGPKTAEKVLDGATTVAEMWERVVAAYEKAKLSEATALTMAQVARICRVSDYDFKAKQPIPWQPPA